MKCLRDRQTYTKREREREIKGGKRKDVAFMGLYIYT